MGDSEAAVSTESSTAPVEDVTTVNSNRILRESCSQCELYTDYDRTRNMAYKVCRNCSKAFCPACKAHLDIVGLNRVYRWNFYEEHPLLTYCLPCFKTWQRGEHF